ncbi:YafY family transcriptional regulator [candidate division KSB1 bacterium]|nr:YafY family transcriptional regulator [candidate division KSB1 bacterium]
MKIDRLLSIIIYLLNRELVSARELATQFEVSVRTIQRDMETLCCSGIPIISVQGAQGGFGIVEGYKLDRQLINSNDLFFILTALESISSTFKNKQIHSTLEKIKSFVHERQSKEIEQNRDKLFIDFSAFSIGRNSSELFALIEKGIENQQLMQFSYTDSNFQVSERLVEPMTVVFKWFSWYLFAFCRLRNDYRLFRLSRMENSRLTPERFERRSKNLEEFSNNFYEDRKNAFVLLTLKFHPSLRIKVEDYFRDSQIQPDETGHLIVKMWVPDDEWLYSMVLGYGERVEVLAPDRIRQNLLKKSLEIAKKYQPIPQ